jgi:hypothetical protein
MSSSIPSHHHSFSLLSTYLLLSLCSFVSPAVVKTGVKARWVLGGIMAELLCGTGRRATSTPHRPQDVATVATSGLDSAATARPGSTPPLLHVRARHHRRHVRSRLQRCRPSGLDSTAATCPGSTPPPPHPGSTPTQPHVRAQLHCHCIQARPHRRHGGHAHADGPDSGGIGAPAVQGSTKVAVARSNDSRLRSRPPRSGSRVFFEK